MEMRHQMSHVARRTSHPCRLRKLVFESSTVTRGLVSNNESPAPLSIIDWAANIVWGCTNDVHVTDRQDCRVSSDTRV